MPYLATWKNPLKNSWMRIWRRTSSQKYIQRTLWNSSLCVNQHTPQYSAQCWLLQNLLNCVNKHTNNLLIPSTMLMVLKSWQGHCKSSSGSSQETGMGTCQPSEQANQRGPWVQSTCMLLSSTPTTGVRKHHAGAGDTAWWFEHVVCWVFQWTNKYNSIYVQLYTENS